MTGGYDPARIRGRLRPVRLARMFRLIHRTHRRRPLHAVPAPSRFSDPAGKYAVLYAAEAVRCCFWEALVRNRFDRRKRRELPRADVEARMVLSFASTEALKLVDLRGDGPIRISAPTAVAHDADHAAGRALSAATHAGVPEAAGFLFQSRFTGHLCVALFDRVIGKLETISIAPLAEHADFLEAIEDYEITLLNPPG
ncbi:MAG TPA: RES domain-containing protein [Kiloniellales bacterium]|nr:RES domain-containing protein [Kiloniellales bacterium]